MKRKVGRWTSRLMGAVAIVGLLLVAGPSTAEGQSAAVKGSARFSAKNIGGRIFEGMIFGTPLNKFNFVKPVERKPACPLIAFTQDDGPTTYRGYMSLATMGGQEVRGPVETARQGLQSLLWFPDGREILFTDREENLMTVDTDGVVLREIAVAPWGVEPTLSPDGKRVAYASALNSNVLIEIDIDQPGNARVIVDMADQRSRIDHVAYSHAGDKLAFELVIPDGLRERYELYVVNRNGTGLRVVDGNVMVAHAEPAWSADDAYLAYASEGIYVVKVETLEKINVSRGVDWSCSLSWVHPLWRGNTHSVYFSDYWHRNLGFAEISAEGSLGSQSVIRKGVFNGRMLDSEDVYLVSISPDGRFAAIVDHRQNQLQDRLYLKEIDGPYLMEMPNPSGRPYGMVAWQPGSYEGLGDDDGDGMPDACGN